MFFVTLHIIGIIIIEQFRKTVDEAEISLSRICFKSVLGYKDLNRKIQFPLLKCLDSNYIQIN